MEHLDIVIVGAGLSGVGAACHLRMKCPGKTFAILEGRDDMGGTWDLFRYPGVRSDSDMYTLGYRFRRWRDAKAIYEQQCAKCHGADGKGDTKMGKKAGAKDYTDPKIQAEMKDDKAFKSIKEGLKDGDKILMKPAEKVTDEEIKALIAYMRTFKKG